MNSRKSLGLQIGATMKIMVKQLQEAFSNKDPKISIDQFMILDILNTKENITQQDVSEILSKDKSLILRQVDDLKKKNLVVRFPDTEDRRKKNLMLTKRGIEVLQKLLEEEAKVFEVLLKDLSNDQIDLLSKTFSSIQVNAK